MTDWRGGHHQQVATASRYRRLREAANNPHGRGVSFPLEGPNLADAKRGLIFDLVYAALWLGAGLAVASIRFTAFVCTGLTLAMGVRQLQTVRKLKADRDIDD